MNLETAIDKIAKFCVKNEIFIYGSFAKIVGDDLHVVSKVIRDKDLIQVMGKDLIATTKDTLKDLED